MSKDIAKLMRSAATAYLDDSFAGNAIETVCSEQIAKELQYWADKLDPPIVEEGYETLRSVSGDLYKMPATNFSAQKAGYDYAVLINDERMMKWFEEGNTGWILVDE